MLGGAAESSKGNNKQGRMVAPRETIVRGSILPYPEERAGQEKVVSVSYLPASFLPSYALAVLSVTSPPGPSSRLPVQLHQVLDSLHRPAGHLRRRMIGDSPKMSGVQLAASALFV
jgi:hypothetical protein